jgi:hypothetical protein
MQPAALHLGRNDAVLAVGARKKSLESRVMRSYEAGGLYTSCECSNPLGSARVSSNPAGDNGGVSLCSLFESAWFQPLNLSSAQFQSLLSNCFTPCAAYASVSDVRTEMKQTKRVQGMARDRARFDRHHPDVPSLAVGEMGPPMV